MEKTIIEPEMKTSSFIGVFTDVLPFVLLALLVLLIVAIVYVVKIANRYLVNSEIAEQKVSEGKMTIFPEEIDLLSLFECEPMLLDKDSPFYYNEATYRFSNGEEDFIVTLSPSYGEVKIQVTQRISNRLLSYVDLKCVRKFEIRTDRKEDSSVLLTVVNEDTQQMIEIAFKPYYKMILKEHFNQ